MKQEHIDWCDKHLDDDTTKTQAEKTTSHWILVSLALGLFAIFHLTFGIGT